MTLSEFRYWLEGYSVAFADGVPNPDQWGEVQRRLALVQEGWVVPASPVVTPSVWMPSVSVPLTAPYPVTTCNTPSADALLPPGTRITVTNASAH
jgi:hypothetical protein